ncbi:hypothetical protein J2W24_002384 [Variovorax boronicumulans]|uniref:Eco57I restriction-modification methylase domain-containing protein n=1 Tax=Variovorax boronicumulans TaxID=436515 RepID=UPI002787915C|nr:N-6 DNA methylase [Variovorax boronicumulans]MDP9916737.1 hypothetical protein [Variovorax boronicumulans]
MVIAFVAERAGVTSKAEHAPAVAFKQPKLHTAGESNLSRKTASTSGKPSLADFAAVHSHCAVYTAPRVAEAMLDRVGWTANADLRGRRLLEPACGDGSFLLPAIERLVASLRRHRVCDEQRLADAIVAFEFDPETAEALKARVVELLANTGLSRKVAARVASGWVRCEDFLLANDLSSFSDVVGNPPYMRWSKVPEKLRRSYEKYLPAYAARGDLCLAFVCRAVELLHQDKGHLAFLCADRWLRCAYGAEARGSLESAVRLSMHLEVHDVPVFVGTRKVGAYAAITILDRDRKGEVVVARATSIDDLCKRLLPDAGRSTASHASRLTGSGGAVLAGADLAATFCKIVESTPTLAEAGVEVRCGMALGCAPVFIVEAETTIESERLVPWIKTRDLLDDGTVEPSARLVDVWNNGESLVDLDEYPELRAHLKFHEAALQKRACVAAPSQWYRTIDRLSRTRMSAPKILVAGMSKFSRVAMSHGGAQPSNAIYSLSSTEWPLAALFAVLRSGALDIFSAVLSPRFSGGVKRFDGNLLRQVRLPRWSEVAPSLQKRLLALDVGTPTPRPELLSELYGISHATHKKALASAVARD